MAKVYSWQITNTQYAYIVDPDNFDFAYVGNKLSGEELEKVKEWSAFASDEDYKTQFQKMKELCLESGYNLSFESVEAYLSVESDCDNLRGKPGRGIKNIRLYHEDEVERKKTYIIEYDDDSEPSTFDIYDGKPGQKGDTGPEGAKGDTPVNYRLIMVYASGKNEYDEMIEPAKPIGGSYDFITGKISYPEGWHASDANLTPPIWMSNKTFTSSDFQIEDWTQPIQITGDNGQPGEDGSSTEFIYCLMDNSGTPPTPAYNNVDDETPGGWEDNPSGVTEDHPYEWMCIRRKNKEGVWGEWSNPSLWSKYGVNGQDGDGVQYIYKRTKKGKQPDNPTPTDYLNDEAYMDPKGEYCPEDEGWTDDPKGVDSTWMYEWVSSRKFKFDENSDKKEKRWQPFSEPSLWAKFGEDGKSATVIRKLYAMNTSTSTPPSVPEGESIFTGDWGSGFPVDYVAGENVVWCIEAEIWADTNEFVKGYVIASRSKDDEGNIITPSDATPENTKIVEEELPTEKVDDPNIKYVSLNNCYYEWKEGWSKPYLITGIKGEDGSPINYSTYVFGYGYEGLVPEKPSGTSPNHPGTSTDSEGHTIVWLDFPDTEGGSKVDGKEENGKIRRWYQSCGSVYGRSNTIEAWGTPFPCNSKDGKAGKYTEFRFGVTDGTQPQHIDATNRENPQYEYNDTSDFWLTIDQPLPSVSGNQIMWQTMAVIDSETNTIESNDHKWSLPVRITGEKGEQGKLGDAGIDGVPGVNLNQRYCLGTSKEYFGSEITTENNDPIPTGWYKGANAPYATVEEFESDNQASSANIKEGSIYKIGEKYYLKTNGNPEEKTSSFQNAGDYNVYIWCTQGENSFVLDKNTTPPRWVESGYTWNPPFRLQGTNGLRGADGSRGQVIYPMGVYNANEVYVTTESRAPYVYDPGDGLYYVYKMVNKPWVGQFPDNYQNIKITVPNGANNDNTYFHTGNSIPTTGMTGGKKYVYITNRDKYYELNSNGTSYKTYEKYKYHYEGILINEDQKGQTPAQNYANNPTNSAWERFETFEALFAKIGIISNGMIGSAVYNNEFMFSQQGTKIDGSPTTYDKTPFLNNLTYIEEGYTSGGTTYHWKDENGTYVSDENANPYSDDNKYSDFIPNICMNFKTGQAWFSGGSIKFEGSTNNIATSEQLTNAKNQLTNSITGLSNSINTLSASTQNLASFTTSASTILNANFDADGKVLSQSGLLVKPNTAGLVSCNASGQTATIGVADGDTIVLDSGQVLISGIMKKSPTVLNANNYNNYTYTFGNTKYLDIVKVGGLVLVNNLTSNLTVNLPIMKPNSNVADNTVDVGFIDRARSFVGANITIYNYSSKNITLKGYLAEDNCLSNLKYNSELLKNALTFLVSVKSAFRYLTNSNINSDSELEAGNLQFILANMCDKIDFDFDFNDSIFTNFHKNSAEIKSLTLGTDKYISLTCKYDFIQAEASTPKENIYWEYKMGNIRKGLNDGYNNMTGGVHKPDGSR